MITEDYVSFETAKLLKDKRFPQSAFKCHYIITDDGYYKSFEDRCGFGDYDIIAPTLAMTMKWLREVHHLFIQPRCCGWNDTLVYYSSLRKIPSNEFVDDATELLHFKTYEEACEAAIKYCLENLI